MEDGGGSWSVAVVGSVCGNADKEAIRTRDYCVAKNATLRADRPDPSSGKKRLPQDDKKI